MEWVSGPEEPCSIKLYLCTGEELDRALFLSVIPSNLFNTCTADLGIES